MPTPAAAFEPCTKNSRREDSCSSAGNAVFESCFLISLMLNLLWPAFRVRCCELIAASLEVVPGGQGKHVGLIRCLAEISGRLRPVGPEMLPLQPHHEIRPDRVDRSQIGALVREVLDAGVVAGRPRCGAVGVDA